MIAGGAVGGNSVSARERGNNESDDGVIDNVPLPIPPQDLPLRMPPTPHAKLVRLHLRHCLVGDCSQHDRLFCCIPCKFTFFYVSLLNHLLIN